MHVSVVTIICASMGAAVVDARERVYVHIHALQENNNETQNTRNNQVPQHGGVSNNQLNKTNKQTNEQPTNKRERERGCVGVSVGV